MIHVFASLDSFALRSLLNKVVLKTLCYEVVFQSNVLKENLVKFQFYLFLFKDYETTFRRRRFRY